MSQTSQHAISKILVKWSNGEPGALDALTPLVYDELKRRARRYMMQEGRRDRHPLQATALVNEVYIKLVDWKNVQLKNRTQFYALAAAMMRHVLVDIARDWRSKRRSGAFRRVDLDAAAAISRHRTEEIIAVDEALQRFEKTYPRAARVVELRHFGGRSIEETAEILNISDETVRRDWIFAGAWFKQELGGSPHESRRGNGNLSRGA